jgi:hypothetical protein
MKVTRYINSPVRLIILITLLVTLLVTATACEGLGFTSSGNTEETEEPEPATQSGAITVNTSDSAILAVYLHLLEQAASPDAKTYLSDFYTECDNWTAEAEYFKDGSEVWHVVVDMTDETVWDLSPYWQHASWFILKNGEVVASNQFRANALRIEADLQALSANTTSSSG